MLESECKQVNAWAQPGPAAFDFRSDVVTSPTLSMLTAIQNATLLDDVFEEDPTTNSLEAYMAERTGHEAALFVTSGTMANLVSLRSHLKQSPYSILCDHRGHILNWEAGGIAALSGALVKGVVPSNGAHLTLEDIKASIDLSEDDVQDCPTRVISLENTLDGNIMPLSEVQRISDFAREHGVKVHLDGARLWEAVTAGAGSLFEYTRCCDTVSLCFSKGLGAPIGSIIVGGTTFIKQARWTRKSVGGGMRQSGVLAAAARVAIEETFDGGLLKKSHDMASRIAAMWTELGGKLQKPVETNMVWLDLTAAGVSSDYFDKLGVERGLQLSGTRLVVHYQISEGALDILKEVFKDAMTRKPVGLHGHVASQAVKGRKVYGST